MAAKLSPMPVTKTSDLSFPHAMEAIIEGKRIRRAEWGDPSVVVFRADGMLKIRLGSGRLDNLILCDGDLDATDWLIVREQ